MNKLEKIQKELKVRFGLVTATAATIFSLGACGNTNTVEQQPVQPTQTTEVTVEPTVDPVEPTVDPVEVDPVEPTVDPVEPEEFTVSADDISILVDFQYMAHEQIPKEEIVALALSFNWDYITDEDKDILMDKYGMSQEDLDAYFRSYLERDREMAFKNGMYYLGDIDTIEPEYDYQNWIKYADFAFKPEDAEFASSYDYHFLPGVQELSPYDMEENSSRYENSFNYTLFYVLNPIAGVEEMENSVFMQNVIVK